MALGFEPIGREKSVCLVLLPLQLPNDGILARPVLPPSQLLQVNLVRTVRDTERADQGPQIRQGCVLANTRSTISLDGAVNDCQSHLRHKDLSLRNLLKRALRIPAIDLDSGIEDDQSCGINLNPGLSNPFENNAMRRQRLAKGLLALVVDTRDKPLERLLRGTNGAHRVVDTPGAQTALDDLEPASFTQDDVRDGHADIVEADVAVAVGGVVVAIHRKHPVHGDSGGVGGDEDNGLPLVLVWVVGVCLAHYDVELAAGVAGAGGPPFLEIRKGISLRDSGT